MPNTNERPVLTDVTGGIATVTLNKPRKLNAWDTSMRAEIAEVLRSWNGDARVHAVVMTGAGDRAFSAGQDLDETEKFQSRQRRCELVPILARLLQFHPRSR